MAFGPAIGKAEAMKRLFVTIATAILISMMLSACGSDSSSADKAGSSTSTPASSVPPGVTLSGSVNAHGTSTASGDTIELEVDDFYFSPTFIKVEPGKKYQVKVKNEGAKFHTFTSSSLGIDEQLSPGTEKTVTVTAPASGSAEFICTPHAGMGMRGAFYTS